MKSPEVSGVKSRGFTLVELLIVLGLLSLLSFASIPVYQNFVFSRDIDETADALMSALRAAHTRSVARLDNATHGVFLDISATPPLYVLYQVPASEPTIDYAHRAKAFDYTVILGPAVTLSTTLVGEEVYFLRGSGVPNISAPASITLTHSTGGARTLNINSVGLVEIQ